MIAKKESFNDDHRRAIVWCWHALLRDKKYSCRTAAAALEQPLTSLIAWEKKFMIKRPV